MKIEIYPAIRKPASTPLKSSPAPRGAGLPWGITNSPPYQNFLMSLGSLWIFVMSNAI
jgi:hypothetical protein